jgi:hypothetical protein
MPAEQMSILRSSARVPGAERFDIKLLARRDGIFPLSGTLGGFDLVEVVVDRVATDSECRGCEVDGVANDKEPAALKLADDGVWVPNTRSEGANRLIGTHRAAFPQLFDKGRGTSVRRISARSAVRRERGALSG